MVTWGVTASQGGGLVLAGCQVTSKLLCHLSPALLLMEKDPLLMPWVRVAAYSKKASLKLTTKHTEVQACM